MSMTRRAALALSLAILATNTPAVAQTPAPTQGTTPPAGATQGTKTPHAPGPAIAGNWSGQPWGGSATSKITLWLPMALSQRSNPTEPME